MVCIIYMAAFFFSNLLFIYRQYLDNIGLVDSSVAELESIIEEFFGHDGKTAYVFTSDHGMTNWGKTWIWTSIKVIFKKRN